MQRTNTNADEFFRKTKTWRKELEQLRNILLDSPLTEAWKWRQPCYTFEKSNIVILGELKACCTLSFFKGVLLKDAKGILEKAGENTRSARVIRFTGVREIMELKPTLQAYIGEAIALEKAGVKVDFDQSAELDLPAELQNKFDEHPTLETAFEALTPGRQRAYLLFFSAAKQSKTRASRVEKYTQQILDGKGMHDCTCGLTQKPPGCDGSHKSLR